MLSRPGLGPITPLGEITTLPDTLAGVMEPLRDWRNDRKLLRLITSQLLNTVYALDGE